MQEEKGGRQELFHPSRRFRRKAHISSLKQLRDLSKEAEDNPEIFWAKQAELLHWEKKWKRVLNDDNPPFYKWFEGGVLNASYNCVDRHLKTSSEKPAIIWQGEREDEVRILTYRELSRQVNKCANGLRRIGVRRGDRVCLYMPMIPELPIAMLALARIGAVHSVVFGAFSGEALKARIQDAQASTLITVDGYPRGGKTIPAWENVKGVLGDCPTLKRVVLVRRMDLEVAFPKQNPKGFFWNHIMEGHGSFAYPEPMRSEDPLFILYTSGSTGKPKGVVHATGGYLTYVTLTFRWIFDYHEDDVFWCTADIGWITGHSYLLYGPLSNGATVMMFEGTPTYPQPDRFWHIIDKFGVTIFYTAPTAIRALIKEGEDWPARHRLSSLRLLGSVGEPINPEAWRWYYRVIGKERCPIVDTWWQTETGGILISPLPGATPLKPGSATLPFPGVEPKILKIKENDEETLEDLSREEAGVGEMGYLVIARPWPGMMQTILNDPERFRSTYFKKFGVYLTGDGAVRDEDGYFWLRGRIDDILLVSGHNISTAEVENALVGHTSVAEAAVVGYPHSIKGEGIYAFVILKAGENISEDLRVNLVTHVRRAIGPIATPDKIQFASNLPKTRSGKIMRRLLRKIASGDLESLGDTTTLFDPTILQDLLRNRIP